MTSFLFAQNCRSSQPRDFALKLDSGFAGEAELVVVKLEKSQASGISGISLLYSVIPISSLGAITQLAPMRK